MESIEQRKKAQVEADAKKVDEQLKKTTLEEDNADDDDEDDTANTEGGAADQVSNIYHIASSPNESDY